MTTLILRWIIELYTRIEAINFLFVFLKILKKSYHIFIQVSRNYNLEIYDMVTWTFHIILDTLTWKNKLLASQSPRVDSNFLLASYCIYM